MELYSVGDLPTVLAIRHELYAVETEIVPDGSGNTGWIYGLTNMRLYGAGWPDILGWASEPTNVPEVTRDTVQTLLRYCRRRWAIDFQLRQVMVNHLAPGGRLEPHRDSPPDDYRFHLPVITAPGVRWWDERIGFIVMELGTWYGPVNYCGILHSMVNDSESVRTHLVVDLYSEGNSETHSDQ